MRGDWEGFSASGARLSCVVTAARGSPQALPQQPVCPSGDLAILLPPGTRAPGPYRQQLLPAWLVPRPHPYPISGQSPPVPLFVGLHPDGTHWGPGPQAVLSLLLVPCGSQCFWKCWGFCGATLLPGLVEADVHIFFPFTLLFFFKSVKYSICRLLKQT